MVLMPKGIVGRGDDKYLVIDADVFKEGLLRQAVSDGNYERWIRPDAVEALERETGETFYPMELASLVHEESFILAADLRRDAIERGDNIVIDTVLSHEQTARNLGAVLNEAGYSVEVIDVEVPYEVSEARIRSRWLEDRQKAEQLGGRWVPSEYARDVFDGPDGKTKSERSARTLAEECPAATRYRVYRTTAEHAQQPQATPTLETDKARPKRGAAEMVDTSQLQTRNPLHTAHSPTARTRECNAFKALDAAQVSYRTVDVTEDPQAVEKLRGLGYMQAPVVVTDSERVGEHLAHPPSKTTHKDDRMADS